MVTTQLTAFQKQCRESVDAILRDVGLSVAYEYVEGREESYLVGRVDSSRLDVKIYIYQDEAGFFVGERWFGYEIQDFSDSGQLVQCFVRDLKDRFDRLNG